MEHESMRTLIALTLFLVGLGLSVYGLLGAIAPIAGLYAAALNDPLAEPPPGTDEKAAANAAWNSAMLGLLGVPPLVIGSSMLSMGILRRIRKGVSR